MGGRQSAMEDVVTAGGARPDGSFWRGRRVFLTGHTGFKGGWLALWLARMGAQVTGLALPPQTLPSLFNTAAIGAAVDSRTGDIRDAANTRAQIHEARPEIVFHLAAQALVRESYQQPVETFAANVMGTVHVLDALRDLGGVRVAVMITTDKVYSNREWILPIPGRRSSRGARPLFVQQGGV